MTDYTVSKCICHDRTFREIKEFAEDHNYSKIDDLQADDYCSCNCGLCIPYIERMFQTGETEFEPGAYYRGNQQNGES